VYLIAKAIEIYSFPQTPNKTLNGVAVVPVASSSIDNVSSPANLLVSFHNLAETGRLIRRQTDLNSSEICQHLQGDCI